MQETDEKIRVVVGGWHDLFREGIAKILDAAADLRVIGEASTATDVLGMAVRDRPDVVLVDADMPGMDAMELFRKLLSLDPVLSVAVLHSSEDVRMISKAMKLGVQVFVSKESTGADLISAIQNASRHQDRVLLSVPRKTIEDLSDPDSGVLTDREAEVIELVARGMRNSDIAKSLYISEGTVKRHLTNIYLKLGVQTRISAVNMAESMHLLRPRR